MYGENEQIKYCCWKKWQASKYVGSLKASCLAHNEITWKKNRKNGMKALAALNYILHYTW
jgi:hypothetical protein